MEENIVKKLVELDRAGKRIQDDAQSLFDAEKEKLKDIIAEIEAKMRQAADGEYEKQAQIMRGECDAKESELETHYRKLESDLDVIYNRKKDELCEQLFKRVLEA